MSNLRNKFKIDTRLNPFHDAFSKTFLFEQLDVLSNNLNISIDDRRMVESSPSSIIFNNFHKQLLSDLEASFKTINLNFEEIIWSHLASINRSCIISNSNSRERHSKATEIHFEDKFGSKIQSADKGIGMIDEAGALELEVDSRTMLINYIRHFEASIPPTNSSLPKLKSINTIIDQSTIVSFYCVLKSCFEDAIWKNGFVELSENLTKITIKFSNPNLLKLYQIGIFRLERNVHAMFQIGMSIWSNDEFPNVSANQKHLTRGIRISNISVSSGYLKYSLTKGVNKNENYIELATESTLMAYYSYLEDVPLPALPGFTLRKLIAGFTVVIQLFSKAANIEIKNTGVKKKEDFYRYPFRIKEELLVGYLKRRTLFNNAEITRFIDFLQSKQRINLWSHPFIKMSGDYYYALLPLSQANILRMVDNWLENGGVSLDQRGKTFESYVKNLVRESLKKRKYQFTVPDKTKFECSKGKEEIDIIISLKNILIIGELKCIKFPLETREISNARSRLEQAADQVKRKTKFLMENIQKFESEISYLKDKKVISIVITNYPMFSGDVINDVPIVDSFLLEAYFNTGSLKKTRTIRENGKAISTEVISEVKFYTNEDECSTNFQSCMISPPAIVELEDMIELKENKISLEGSHYEIYIQTANYKSQN